MININSYAFSPKMLPQLEIFWKFSCGIAFSAVITFFEYLQYPEIFVPLSQALFLETEVIWIQIRGTGWVLRFSHHFLGQKLL
jgi:hypothetical protein